MNSVCIFFIWWQIKKENHFFEYFQCGGVDTPKPSYRESEMKITTIYDHSYANFTRISKIEKKAL